ncbi:MAG: peptidoglycan-binding protein [Pseudomonadota bacterium]
MTAQLQVNQWDPGLLNGELMPARSAINTALIGLPRGVFGAAHAAPTNPDFKRLLETADLGPFSVTGLSPAIRTLRAIVTDISLECPDLYDALGCKEMLSCRLVRGSSTIISNHAWGIAVDLSLDVRSDSESPAAFMDGMIRLWPIFNRHGFYWGYAFGQSNANHFEASDQLVRAWAESGVLDAPNTAVLPRALNLGDRGPQVQALQAALNRVLKPLSIAEDGLFGPQTRMAVFELQRKAGLPATGAAPKPVLAALGLD